MEKQESGNKIVAQGSELSAGLGGWVARYEFAGATGSYGTHNTKEEAERDAEAIDAHYHGLARIWIEQRAT